VVWLRQKELLRTLQASHLRHNHIEMPLVSETIVALDNAVASYTRVRLVMTS
jgi:hypothetical protein